MQTNNFTEKTQVCYTPKRDSCQGVLRGVFSEYKIDPLEQLIATAKQLITIVNDSRAAPTPEVPEGTISNEEWEELIQLRVDNKKLLDALTSVRHQLHGFNNPNGPKNIPVRHLSGILNVCNYTLLPYDKKRSVLKGL